jgi:pyruvate,water dikinase
VVQGAVNPDEFYVYKPNVTAGRPAILRKTSGAKAIKMIFGDQTNAGDRRSRSMWNQAPTAISITDSEVEELARYALLIEDHYARPMDIEWGRDGQDGKLYILQAAPETVKSRDGGENLRRYRLKTKSKVLASGRAIGQKVGQGTCEW